MCAYSYVHIGKYLENKKHGPACINCRSSCAMAYIYRLIALLAFALLSALPSTSFAYPATVVPNGTMWCGMGSCNVAFPGCPSGDFIANGESPQPGGTIDCMAFSPYSGTEVGRISNVPATVYSCPNGGTNPGNANTCTCPPDETDDGTKCSNPPCPQGQSADFVLGMGWVPGASGGGANFSSLPAFPSTVCASVGSHLCIITPGGIGVVLPGSPVNGYYPVTESGTGTLTGAQCGSPSPTSVTTAAPVCAGQLGSVNGISTCISATNPASLATLAQQTAAADATQASSAAGQAVTDAGGSSSDAAAAAAAAASAAAQAANLVIMNGGSAADAASAASAAGAAASAAAVASAHATSAAYASGADQATAVAAGQAAAAAAGQAAAAAQNAGLSPAAVSQAGASAGLAAGAAAAAAMSSARANSVSAAVAAAAAQAAGAMAGNAVAAGATLNNALAAGATAAQASISAGTSTTGTNGGGSRSSTTINGEAILAAQSAVVSTAAATIARNSASALNADSSVSTAAVQAAQAAASQAQAAAAAQGLSPSAQLSAGQAAASAASLAVINAAASAQNAALSNGASASAAAAAADAAATGAGASTAASGAGASAAATSIGAAAAAKAAAGSNNPLGAASSASNGAANNSIQDYCTSNPNANICKDNTWSAGACGAPPACSGDAVECGIATQAFLTACALTTAPADTAEVTVYKNALAADKGGDETTAYTSVTNITNSMFDSTNILGGGAGLTDFGIAIAGQTINIPMSNLNTWFAMLGRILQIVTFILCARIIARG